MAIDLVGDPEPEISLPIPFAVATAVIEVEANHPEHRTSDIRLEITKDGGEIVHRQVYYNVSMAEGGLPDSNEFQFQPVTSLYLFLPVGQTFDAGDAHVELPEDGGPPNFEDLRDAVNAVLDADPGAGEFDLEELTPQHSKHVAREIIFNADRHPLPEPPRPLHQLYTDPSDEEDMDRRQFEGELQAYYAIHNASAERLTGYVFALSAAEANTITSEEASEAGLEIRLLVTEPGQGKIAAVQTILTATGPALNPSFAVPAEDFYPLGAVLSPRSTREQRYQLATLATEQQTLNQLRRAIEDGVINEPAVVNDVQAVRRFVALGATLGSAPRCELEPGSAVQGLVQAWLDFPDEDIGEFWETAVGTNADGPHAEGHLDLILCALTDNHTTLIDEIKDEDGGANTPFGPITNVAELAAINTQGWRDLFLPTNQDGEVEPRTELLPAFTQPGSPEERVSAFIRHLQKFFSVSLSIESPVAPELGSLPLLRISPEDPIRRFVDAYNALIGDDGEPFEFGSEFNESHFLSAIDQTLPEDPAAQAWLEQVLRTIHALWGLVQFGQEALRFSLVEALYSRGFTGPEQIRVYAVGDFQEALTGTVAFGHAAAIHARAQPQPPAPVDTPDDVGFQPVNTDCCLVNCIPPPHLSPLGPVAYLHEMLRVTPDSTCNEPFPLLGTGVIIGNVPSGGSISDHINSRCGSPAELLVTHPNLDTPLPVIDSVNECLEAVTSSLPALPVGHVHNTAGDELGGHALCRLGPEPDQEPKSDEPCHDPATLFEALPEHSTPATPVAEPGAYEILASDFSHCLLPYSQPLDVNRTYLNQLGTSRFETMRTFREQTSEFVLEPENPPAEFESHRWREPVSELIAAEYLGISQQVLNLLFEQDIATSLPADEDQLILWEMYGFPAEEIDGESWLDIVVQLREFLKRTCLTYCEFLELWRSGFVSFHRSAETEEQRNFPDCEPCELDFVIEFDDPSDPAEALRRLIVFIRLWRILQRIPGAQYSFLVLRDICVELGLFNDDGTINPDFIRQLSAFQRTRDLLGLPLFDEDNPPLANQTDAARTHLLSLRDRPDPLDPTAANSNRFLWALDQVLDKLQPYAQAAYKCPRKPPHFLKLLAENMDPLSRLAGFRPDNPGDTWHAQWTHILRMIEVLGKIYASHFSVGQILYLFTADEHLHGDDPFPLQSPNEALCRPFDLPDDLPEFFLLTLRDKLLAVDVSEEEASAFTWTQIESILREEFGYAIPAGETDHLLSFGRHFIPEILEGEGISAHGALRRYRTSLSEAQTSPPMWNTPLGGPFRYDTTIDELWTELALTDEAVLWKLSRVRALQPIEMTAVRAIYFAPRVDLCALGFLFPNMGEADERLIQEPDEQKRWAYFQSAFAVFYARCKIIAAHLAEHVAKVTGRPNKEGIDLAWQVLRHLRADENFAISPWEVDSGEVPEFTWGPQPHCGAFAALLGLVGTGLLGTYRRGVDAPIAWQEVRSRMGAFGEARNAMNAPVPTLIPSMSLGLNEQQQQFLGIRNGFGMDPETGEVLGGLEEYVYTLQGLLLVENEGDYKFSFEVHPQARKFLRWFVRLQQGQKVWSVLVSDWPDEEGPADSSAPLPLRRGVYEVEVHVQRLPLLPNGPEDVCPQLTGFEVKYLGPDTGGEWMVPPHERLFLEFKDGPLEQEEIPPHDFSVLEPVPADALGMCCPPTVRDIRRTYNRAHKALLCAHNHGLSAQVVTDSGQSEFDFFLAHPPAFQGVSYFRIIGGFDKHHAHYDFNFLPKLDNYHPPEPSQDQRAQPSERRIQALFDLFFEALFDYSRVREDAAPARETPAVNALHEWAEAHADPIAHGLRHLGIHLFHQNLVLRYFDGLELSSADLLGFHWLYRVWQAEKWIRNLKVHFLAKDIRTLRPDLVAATDPAADGNANLTSFYRDGSIENEEPLRYLEIKQLNDGLRERGRQSLLAYLTGMDRVALPWGGFAETPKDLSELFLIDIEAGVCQKASRVEEAISSTHLFIQRARLGLEPTFDVTDELILLWDHHFATYKVWLICKRRELYPENWIAWTELYEARRTEGFRFLESELRRATLTVPVPGGLEHWPNQRPPTHPGLTTLQAREPASIARLEPPNPPTPEGFDLMGTPERHARPSWLAALRREEAPPSSTLPPPPLGDEKSLPFWIQAAIRLGVRFVRVAAAGEPMASTRFHPRRSDREIGCCVECGQPHPALVDEYYFWLLDSRYFDIVEQNSDWGVTEDNSASDWRRPDMLPGLLHWQSEPMVHLFWCRVHNGELKQTRRSFEGVRVDSSDDPPQLDYLGRSADSLRFSVIGGQTPDGFSSPPDPGFRYDIATDSAVVLPEFPNFAGAAPDLPGSPEFVGGLPVYPYFAYHAPGAPLVPPTLFSPAMIVAGHLRSHCRFEAALKWYECFFNPLQEDLSEIWCIEEAEPPVPDPGGAVPAIEAPILSEELARDDLLSCAT